jgi:hypothetical protein
MEELQLNAVSEANMDVTNKQKALEPHILNAFRNAAESLRQNDMDAYMDYAKQAKIMMNMGGYLPTQMGELMAKGVRAMTEKEGIISQFYNLHGELFQKYINGELK